ncbi:MAG: hypothetical protein IJ493_05100 [Clostridia bacterium]|nr:hypothetical protein [Clostridia bacterium]
MKRIVVLLLTVVLFAMPLAAAEFETGWDLKAYWDEQEDEYNVSPYPDYIGGFWIDNKVGLLTVGVIGDEGEAEVLRLVEDDGSIQIVRQKYSYTELMSIRNMLEDVMRASPSPVLGVGIDQSENYVTVAIDVAFEGAFEFVRDLKKAYGDRIYYEPTVGIWYTAEQSKRAAEAVPFAVWVMLVCVLLGVTALLLRRRRLAATTAGTTMAITSRQLESALREDTVEPSGEVWEKIRRSTGC